MQTEFPEIIPEIGDNHKFLPKKYSTPAAIDIFGDRVNILSDIQLGKMGTEFSFTVIVNKQIADAFRTWFQFMWDFCPNNLKK